MTGQPAMGGSIAMFAKVQAFTATIATLSENHFPARKGNTCHVFFVPGMRPLSV
jgi:hypothetical protein